MSRSRAARDAERAFLVEGPVLIDVALTAGAPLQAVFVEQGATTRGGVAEVTAAAAEQGIDVWEVPTGALDRATDVVTSSGIVAVAARVDRSLHPVVVGGPPAFVIVLAGVTDPGNAGTLLRTAEASGASAVVFTDGAVDPTNPKCVRASAGALFHLPVVVAGDGASVLADLARSGVRRVGTAAVGGRPYHDADLTGRVALVLGSEAHGLPPSLAGAIDELVTIPMAGRSESLNVAMAGAVVCFEALRQRRRIEVDDGEPRAAVFAGP